MEVSHVARLNTIFFRFTFWRKITHVNSQNDIFLSKFNFLNCVRAFVFVTTPVMAHE